MNKWQCECPGCDTIAIGTGGAAGLRAIGWFFEPGMIGAGFVLLCPAHRPDPIPCLEGGGTNLGNPCALCQGERVAASLQGLIASAAGRRRYTYRCASPGCEDIKVVLQVAAADGITWIKFVDLCPRCREVMRQIEAPS